MNVLIILAVLFIALVVIIPLIERSRLRISDQDAAKMSRWVWPLLMIMLVLQLLYLMFK